MSLDTHVIDHPAEAEKACYASYPDDATAMAAGLTDDGCAYYNTTYRTIRWFVNGQFNYKQKIPVEVKYVLSADSAVDFVDNQFTFDQAVTDNSALSNFPAPYINGLFRASRRSVWFYQFSLVAEHDVTDDSQVFQARVEGPNGGTHRYNTEWRKRRLTDGGPGENLMHYQAEGLIQLSANQSMKLILVNWGDPFTLVVKADPNMSYFYAREV